MSIRKPSNTPKTETNNPKEHMAKKIRGKITKVITLPDIHFPENIDLKPILDFIEDEKPDQIIYLGDIINGDGISKFWDGDEEEGVYDTANELEAFTRKIHDRIKAIAPKKCKFVLTGGNHFKQRADRAIERKPVRDRLLDIKQYMPDLEVYEYNELYNVGDLYYTHGIYHNDMHAKKTVLNTGRNVIMGHTHTIQQYTMQTMADDEPKTAKAIGCLCNVNPHYARHKPNAWAHAFHIAHVLRDGSFFDQTIQIKHGKFIYNNKMYDGKSRKKQISKRIQKKNKK